MKTFMPRALAAAIAASIASDDSASPVGSAPKSSTDTEFRTFLDRPVDLLEIHQVDDGPGRVRALGHREPDLGAGPVDVVEQDALLVVEVRRPERCRERRRRSRERRHARALGNPPVGVQQAGVRVVRERILVVEPRVLGRERQRRAALPVDGERDRSVDAATRRRVRDAVADGDRVRGTRQRELDVLAGRGQLDGLAPRSLAGERVGRRVEWEDGAVRVGVLGFLLDEVDIGAATRGERRIDRRDGDARGAVRATAPAPPPTAQTMEAVSAASAASASFWSIVILPTVVVAPTKRRRISDNSSQKTHLRAYNGPSAVANRAPAA